MEAAEARPSNVGRGTSPFFSVNHQIKPRFLTRIFVLFLPILLIKPHPYVIISFGPPPPTSRLDRDPRAKEQERTMPEKSPPPRMLK